MDEKGDTVLPGNTSRIQIIEHKCEDIIEENPKFKDDIVRRIHVLREVMAELKIQLKEEKELWRKEIDELNKLQCANSEQSDESKVSQSVISAAEPYDSYAIGSVPIVEKRYEPFMNKLPLMEYEKKLTRCHDVFPGLHSEKRQQMRRQLAAHTYKKKLMEVERMCNIELARVRQTASFLEPLNKIASEWNLPPSEANKSAKFLSLSDLHTNDNHTNIIHADIPTDMQLTQQIRSSVMSADVHLSRSVGQLSASDSDKEHVTLKMAVAHEVQSTTIWQGEDVDPEQTGLLRDAFSAHIPRVACTIIKN